MKNILPPIHTSPETAFVVADYPYGFRLRCKIRYWLETNKNGSRLCSQTTDPRVCVDANNQPHWNKPKKSTYSSLGGALFLNEEGHLTWTGAHHYMETPVLKAWFAEYQPGLLNSLESSIARFIAIKEVHDEELAAGNFPREYCYLIASLTGATRKDGTVITRAEAQAKVQAKLDEKRAAAAPTSVGHIINASVAASCSA